MKDTATGNVDIETGYNQLMTQCIISNEFNRRPAIREFIYQLDPQGKLPWVRNYAHKVYNRVVTTIRRTDSMNQLILESVDHIRNALNHAADRGEHTGNWADFKDFMQIAIKMTGVGVTPVQVTQTTNQLNIHSTEAIEERKRFLENALRIPATVDGGVLQTQAGQPTVDVPATSQATTSPPITG